MVEAFGANGGITPPMRKGIKGQNVCYNIDDGFDGYNSTLKNDKRSLHRRARARVMDLQYYLGESWIDYKAVNYEVNNKKSKEGGQAMIASKALKCIKCSKPYETKVVGSRGAFVNRYLPVAVFNNVPLDNGECGLCG